MPSNSNFPASHLGSQLGLIAQSYGAFSSPPLGRPTRFLPLSPPAKKTTKPATIQSACLTTSHSKQTLREQCPRSTSTLAATASGQSGINSQPTLHLSATPSLLP